MRHFCTYFDSHYLARGLALYDSLARHSESPWTLWVLCFDALTYEILSRLRLPHLQWIAQADFERNDPELLSVKSKRSRIEYYWSSTPSLPLYLLKKDSSIDLVTYLDSDLFFFSSPEPVFEEFGNRSLLLTEHRFSPAHQSLQEVTGIYNVGMMAFRKDEAALEALRWWREKCLEHCSQKPAAGLFGDQFYLNDWPRRFPGVHILRHPGADVAPWNAARYSLQDKSGTLRVNGSPLIYYHYHAFSVLNDWLAVTDKWGYEIPSEYSEGVYRPYFRALQKGIARIRNQRPDFDQGYDAVSVRALCRFIEQGKVLISIEPRTAGRFFRQLKKLQFPSPSNVLREFPGVAGRFLIRNLQRRLTRCGSSLR